MKTVLKAIAWTLLLATAWVHAEDRPPVADKVVAYQAQEGIKVWTLRIGERSANQALVQVEGADHDWNLKIHKMNVEKTARDTRYVTEVNGNRFVALIVQNGYGELYLPGEGNPVRVYAGAGLADQGNAQYFLTDYLNQATAP